MGIVQESLWFEVAKRSCELLLFTYEIQAGLILIPIDSDHLPDLYSIRGKEIGEGIDNKALDRQLQKPRVIMPFAGVQEQKAPRRVGYAKTEFSLGSFRYSLLESIEFLIQNTVEVILSRPIQLLLNCGGCHCASSHPVALNDKSVNLQ
jgi:hypothetical protein